ncbi:MULTISPECIES: glutamine synthetase family protein [Micromonospora]|uniref:Glutamine synthetase n=1 Tax=Micromonospora solifontis TaxID=2487138 RepID=A0ABX9WLR7_9ACTN|nr:MULTISPECIES: glutamine synthetase family protein [Micromonospora]NES12738.1 glutamine synthetase [Micromonospora sp. PPF5-17B]NES34925.1 glutamine synthetase [Micromonospora solifontis]NES54663.1 glutamine synthetase [Micromonospora sp. PPF5-6]RNM01490.1 glutamine synthetase [Micromonospora solifontis]
MRKAPLTLEQLRVAVAEGEIDTVVLALTDMQGRLQGKRFHAPYFLDQVVGHGSEGCNYLLAVDVDMNTVDGYAMSSWERGYGDFAMRPDLATLRRMPWQPGSALLLADLEWLDGSGPVVASPRQILRRQLDRLAAHGLTAYAGTELEFVLYRDSYEEAWRRGYRELTPANQYNVDYSLLGTARVEPLLRRIRTEMAGAGLTPESAKGECNLGQHEIAFRYDEAVACADHHVIYKNGAKEIAAQEGMSITFMAKPNAREGNSCHIHFSLRDASGSSAMLGDGPANLSVTGQRVLAGLLATMREFSLFFAPNVNSYKRYQPGSFAPTALRWGTDNRTCALRLVGHGQGMRVENRVPGADVNPYLAIAALVAGAVHGIERELELDDECTGNAYDDATAERVPGTLRDALTLWQGSTLAVDAFGEDVVAHYANHARVELAAFDAAVTDWELTRGFERL